jgi:abortive infection bacteriophage resistance protein
MEHNLERYVDKEAAKAFLVARGIDCTYDQEVGRFIEQTGLFRLEAYLAPFLTWAEQFSVSKTSTVIASFRDLHELYMWDSQIRGVVLSGIEPIEVLLRAQIALRIVKYGPFGHLNSDTFSPEFSGRLGSNGSKNQFDKLLENLEKKRRASKETFVKDSNARPGSIRPIWTEVEIMDFGNLTAIYSGMRWVDREEIAASFGCQNPKILDSWLSSINEARNYCAHHSRLWNRKFVRKPSLKSLRQIDQIKIEKDKPERLGAVVNVMTHVLEHNNDPGLFLGSFLAAVAALPEHPAVNTSAMGFALLP